MPPVPAYPGVFVEETGHGGRTVAGVETSVAVFVGRTSEGPLLTPKLVQGWGEYTPVFGAFDAATPFAHCVSHFFANGGRKAYVVRVEDFDPAAITAALDEIDAFNLLCVPGQTDPALSASLVAYCVKRGAFGIFD